MDSPRGVLHGIQVAASHLHKPTPRQPHKTPPLCHAIPTSLSLPACVNASPLALSPLPPSLHPHLNSPFTASEDPPYTQHSKRTAFAPSRSAMASAMVASSTPFATGFRPTAVAFPRGLGSSQLRIRSSRRVSLVVRASSNGHPESDDKNRGEKGKVDWDKAWESFPKPKQQQGKSGNPVSKFLGKFNLNMEQYVNRRPEHSNFPLSEETDSMRKTERRALDAWTDPKFTYAGLGVVVGLFVYMVVVVGPPPS